METKRGLEGVGRKDQIDNITAGEVGINKTLSPGRKYSAEKALEAAEAKHKSAKSSRSPKRKSSTESTRNKNLSLERKYSAEKAMKEAKWETNLNCSSCSPKRKPSFESTTRKSPRRSRTPKRKSSSEKSGQGIARKDQIDYITAGEVSINKTISPGRKFSAENARETKCSSCSPNSSCSPKRKRSFESTGSKVSRRSRTPRRRSSSEKSGNDIARKDQIDNIRAGTVDINTRLSPRRKSSAEKEKCSCSPKRKISSESTGRKSSRRSRTPRRSSPEISGSGVARKDQIDKITAGEVDLTRSISPGRKYSAEWARVEAKYKNKSNASRSPKRKASSESTGSKASSRSRSPRAHRKVPANDIKMIDASGKIKKSRGIAAPTTKMDLIRKSSEKVGRGPKLVH